MVSPDIPVPQGVPVLPAFELSRHHEVVAAPFGAGGENVTRAAPRAGKPIAMERTEPGEVRGTIGALASLGDESPTELCAVTVKVYGDPLMSPITVQWVGPDVVQP